VSQSLNNVALSILSGLHTILIEDMSMQPESPLVISEAARLAGLTHVLSSVQLENPHRFSHLSYQAERKGVSQDSITKLADEALEMFRHQLPMNLSTDDLVLLLGMIHSLGCYALPLAYNEGTVQKPLGAFYTPQMIADYIVTLTISPTLDRLAASASKNGATPLEEILTFRTLDPACGTGVFLISAMNAFIRALRRGIRNAIEGGTSRRVLSNSGVLEFSQSIRNNMFGVDIDSGALEVTDTSLRLLSQSNSNELNASSLGTSLKQGNSLISLKGMNGAANHNHFFVDTASRSPFEWNDEFGDILEQGGFDFIVMNPPYERLKPNLAEFLRERLLTGERQLHMDAFSRHKEQLSEDVRYFRDSGEYRVGNKYSLDTHRLFIERALHLTRKGGNIGFIVPSTILGDLSSLPLRRVIIQENRLLTIDDFPEASRLFEGVTQSVSVLTLKRGGKTKSILARFGLKDINHAKTHKQIRLPADKIERVVGSSFSIPQVDKVSWSLISKIHRHPSIATLDWLSVKRGELDLTLNRDCITSKTMDFRLIRGSNISRFSLHHRNKKRPEFVDIDKLRKTLGSSSRAEHISQPRIACQQISNRSQRWRLKFAPIPPDCVLANSCNYIIDLKSSSESHCLFLLGILNSELMNWRFDLTNTNNHVSTRELTQLPIVDIYARESQDFSTSLIEEVKHFSTESSSKIEALVFALYGFSVEETKDLLKMRYNPEEERHAILNQLRALTE
jgi:adenine-specific DNA-methyltransferase